MRFVLSALCVALGLFGCTATDPTRDSGVSGRLVAAGPTSSDMPELSMRWQYGIQMDADLQTIERVEFDCSPIPATSFSVQGSELRGGEAGVAYADGPPIVISEESTPWLFDRSTTTATCRAVVSRRGFQDLLLEAQVQFPPATKEITLQQFRAAHDYNRRLRDRP